ncbi:MAG: transglutaminase family protein [Candidatus Methylacidiphilales bacterium]|nr:transglutaminase-like domain-containing protein [Candidatus Methylacidiphilales bacterium]
MPNCLRFKWLPILLSVLASSVLAGGMLFAEDEAKLKKDVEDLQAYVNGDKRAASVTSSEPESELVHPEGYKLVRDEYTLDSHDGQRTGHTHFRIYSRQTAQGLIYLTRSWTESTSLREGDVLRTTSTAQCVEDAAGRLISFRNVDMETGSRVVVQGQVVGKTLHVNNNGTRRTYPYPEGMIGPRLYDEMQRTRAYKEGDTYRVICFESTSPEVPDVIDHKVIGKEKKRLVLIPGDMKEKSEGVEMELWKVEEKHSQVPRAKICCWISPAKRAIMMSEADIPNLGLFQSVLCKYEDTQKSFHPVAFEQDSDIVVTPGLTNHKSLTMARYELSAPGSTAEGPAVVIEGPEQKILSRTEGKLELEVRRLTFASASVNWKLPFRIEASTSEELRRSLESAPYIELTPAIRELSKRAVRDETNPVLATRAIERYVRAYIINKNYSAGFHTAAETAYSRSGDCTEHAVLCAALARAAGLPARVVVGLGYLPRDYSDKDSKDGKPAASGSFGFHMWAEAYVGNPGAPDSDAQWQPMDAALDGFDVGHIAILRTALSDSQSMLDMTNSVTQFMGKLSIRILETK